MDSLGERLKKLRIKNGYTQERLAAELDISNGQVSKIESDKSSNITLKLISAYMHIFSVSADYIISGFTANNSIDMETYSENDRMILELFYSLTALEQEEIKELIEFKLQRKDPEKRESISPKSFHSQNISNRLA